MVNNLAREKDSGPSTGARKGKSKTESRASSLLKIMAKWNYKSGERVIETLGPRLHSGMKARTGYVVAQVDSQLCVKFDDERASEWIHVREITALSDSMQIVRELATAKSCY